MHKHIDRKLMMRLRMFILAGVIMLGIAFYDVMVGQIIWWLVLVGLVVGLMAGYLAGRMFTIVWHEEDAKVISKLDKTSWWVILIYIAFSLSRRYVANVWIHGPALLAFVFATVSGVMIGRLIYTTIHIQKILDKQGIK